MIFTHVSSSLYLLYLLLNSVFDFFQRGVELFLFLAFSFLYLQNINEVKQMFRLSKHFNLSVLSFLRLLRSSDILVLVIINFLSMTASIRKVPYQDYSRPIYEKIYNLRGSWSTEILANKFFKFLKT